MKARLMLAASLMAMCSFAMADEARPFKEGPVTVVTYVKVKDGQFENYMKWLDTNFKPLNEELMKAKVSLGYKVYASRARDPNDPDLILSVTYANMGALDNLNERAEPIAEKFQGDRAKRAEASAARGSMRQILGSKVIRELVLK